MKKGQVNNKITDLIALSRIQKQLKLCTETTINKKHYLRDPVFP